MTEEVKTIVQKEVKIVEQNIDIKIHRVQEDIDIKLNTMNDKMDKMDKNQQSAE